MALSKVIIPNGVQYAFNPIIIALEGDELMSIQVAVGVYTARYMAHDGKVVQDISTLMQLQYDASEVSLYNYTDTEVAKTCKDVEFTVTAYGQAGVVEMQQTNTCTLVWGALYVGERMMDMRHMTWFKGYPFLVSLMREEGNGGLIISVDGVKEIHKPMTYKGVVNLPLEQEMASAKFFIDIYDYQNSDYAESIWDETFGFQFRERELFTQVAHIDVTDCRYENPIYVRWIDRHGFLCHWLLKGIQRKSDIEGGTAWYRMQSNYDDDERSMRVSSLRMRNYNRSDILSAVAPLVSQDDWNTLIDLVSSPIVDMYLPGMDRWIPISANGGTITNQMNVPLQDFVIELSLQPHQLQSI